MTPSIASLECEHLTSHCKHVNEKLYTTPHCCRFLAWKEFVCTGSNAQHASRGLWIVCSLGCLSFLQSGSFLWIVKILQVEVKSLLSGKQLIVDRRLELPTHYTADIFTSAIARLCRFTDFHVLSFWHVALQRCWLTVQSFSSGCQSLTNSSHGLKIKIWHQLRDP